MEDTISSQSKFSLTNEYAYVLGVYLGDGFDLWNEKTRSYQFRLKSIDKDFVKNVNNAIEKITRRRGVISERKDDDKRFGKRKQWILIYCHKNFVERLKSLTIEKTEIPEMIKVADREKSIWFIRGLMDSEGWISKNYWQIGIAMTNERLMKDIEPILLKIGIRIGKMGIASCKSGKKIFTRIFKKPIEVNPFTIQRKSKRFRDYTRSIHKDEDIIH